MAIRSISITMEEYESLKRKAAIADDIILQLESSLKDLEAERIKKCY